MIVEVMFNNLFNNSNSHYYQEIIYHVKIFFDKYFKLIFNLEQLDRISWQFMTHSHILKRATARSLDSKFQAPT